MRDTGKDEGIAFDHKPGARSPNTLAAHALMLLARDVDGIDQSALAEKLFHAHHVDCEDIGDIDVLKRIAEEAGIDAEGLADRIAHTEARVQKLIEESVQKGVSGVPFFIINGKYGISGAQPADTLAAAFDQIAGDSNTS